MFFEEWACPAKRETTAAICWGDILVSMFHQRPRPTWQPPIRGTCITALVLPTTLHCLSLRPLSSHFCLLIRGSIHSSKGRESAVEQWIRHADKSVDGCNCKLVYTYIFICCVFLCYMYVCYTSSVHM
jgi:hypothetical protein